MASLAQRVALVRQSEIHIQLATAQETAEGDASKAVHHYLAAMELLGCALDDLFCIGPNGTSSPKAAQFGAPQGEVFFQVTVSKKLAAYRERVKLLMDVVEETGVNSELVTDEPAPTPDEAVEEAVAEEQLQRVLEEADAAPFSTAVPDSSTGEDMFNELYKKFVDAAEED